MTALRYSHKDGELRDQGETHQEIFQRQNAISTRHDRKIVGGEKQAGLINESIRGADLILLLVGADFLGVRLLRRFTGHL